MLALVVAITALPRVASAQDADRKARAKLHFNAAKVAYQAGEYAAAAALYKRAFEQSPHPLLFYNIAESYKKLDDCAQSLHYYRRYVSSSEKQPLTTRRTALEHRARRLIADYARKCPPKPVSPPAPPTPRVVATPTPQPRPLATSLTKTPQRVVRRLSITERPSRVAIGVAAGPTLLTLASHTTPTMWSVGADASVRLGSVFDVGLAGLLTPVPFTTTSGSMTGTALLTGVMASAGAELPVSNRVSIRAQVGAGMLIISGLGAGNPFFDSETQVEGAISAVQVRGAAGLRFAATRSLGLQVMPAVSYSPTDEQMAAEVSLMRIEIMLGAVYRM